MEIKNRGKTSDNIRIHIGDHVIEVPPYGTVIYKGDGKVCHFNESDDLRIEDKEGEEKIINIKSDCLVKDLKIVDPNGDPERIEEAVRQSLKETINKTQNGTVQEKEKKSLDYDGHFMNQRIFKNIETMVIKALHYDQRSDDRTIETVIEDLTCKLYTDIKRVHEEHGVTEATEKPEKPKG